MNTIPFVMSWTICVGIGVCTLIDTSFICTSYWSPLICFLLPTLSPIPSPISPQIKDFVKHGKEEGYVELQLHNDRGRNPVIKRMMKMKDNSSTWLLNGKQVLLKEVGYDSIQSSTPFLVSPSTVCIFLYGKFWLPWWWSLVWRVYPLLATCKWAWPGTCRWATSRIVHDVGRRMSPQF